MVSDINRVNYRTSVALGISLAAVVLWIAANSSTPESSRDEHVVSENLKSADVEVGEGNADAAAERPGKRRAILLNPSEQEIEAQAEFVDSLTVLEVIAVPIGDEEASLPRAFFQSLSRYSRLTTVTVGSHRHLTPDELWLLSNVPTLKAAVFHFTDDNPADDQTLNSLGPFQQLELIGIYGGSFSEKSLNEFKRRNANTQIELYRPGVYGDVFDWSGCINGKFHQKYISPREE